MEREPGAAGADAMQGLDPDAGIGRAELGQHGIRIGWPKATPSHPPRHGRTVGPVPRSARGIFARTYRGACRCRYRGRTSRAASWGSWDLSLAPLPARTQRYRWMASRAPASTAATASPSPPQARDQQRPAAAGGRDEQQPQVGEALSVPGCGRYRAAASADPGSRYRLVRRGRLGSSPAAVRAGSFPSASDPWCPADQCGRRWGMRWLACRLPMMAPPGHPGAAPKARAAWRRANSAASPGLITKVPGWAAVQRSALAGPVKCRT